MWLTLLPRLKGLLLALTSSLLASSPQTITFRALPAQILGMPPFLVSAQATSGLPVSLTSGSPSVCRVSGGMVMLLATGACTVVAAQPGNAAYTAAPSVRQSFSVNAAHTSGALSAAPGSPVTVAPNEYAVAVADFNLDGIPDLATASGGGNSVTVLLGNGTGGFSIAPGSPVPTGSGQLGIVTGDFNGDGIPDLAAGNSASGVTTVTILLGNGQGGFSPGTAVSLSPGTGPIALAAGDFNGDGMLDLVVADRVNSNVTILLGNGKGSFAPTPASPITLGAAYIGPGSIVVGDFNDDGFQDLAIANQTSNNITILMGTGNGGFTPGPVGFLRTGLQPFCIAAGDFNGDGNLDLATADNAGNAVTVMLGTGNGGFTPAIGSPYTIPSPWSIAVGDVNGDGIVDLVVGSAVSGITALTGNGRGAFTITNGSPTLAIPIYVALADFNGDGILDIANANYGTSSVSVLLGGVALTSLALSPSGTTTVPFGQAVPLTATLSVTGVPFTTPTGLVTFSDGTTLLGAAAQSTSPYTFTASSLAGGSHTITATYGGDSKTMGAVSSVSTVYEGGPTPTLTSLSPSTWSPGGAAFTLTVTGTGFTAASQVLWNGAPLTTKYIGATQVSAAVPASVISSAGAAAISVSVPWATSNSVQYTFVPPTVTTLSPASWLVGGPDFTLTVNGTGFVPNTQVLWNGSALTTKFLTATQVTAAVPAATVSSAGAANIGVSNAPGAVSNTVQYPDVLPTLTSVSPTTYLAGGVDFTLTLNGTGFVQNSQVLWNGIALTTKFITATQLTADVTAATIGAAGTGNVAVSNALGAVSGSLAVTAILPAITTLKPTSWLVGGADFTLAVNGTGFTPNSQVLWNSTALPTKLIGPTQLTASVTAATIVTPGATSISVSNAPGVMSNSISFPDALPTVTTLAPANWLIGGPDFTLTVNGTNFVPNSQVEWNGTPVSTKFMSATQLAASISAMMIASAAPVNVAVTNAVGAASNGIQYMAAAPTLVSLNPASALASGPDFKLCITGTNFAMGSQILWNGAALSTNFVSANSLCTTVPGTLITVAGSADILVMNPDGTPSPKIKYPITNPVPAVPQGGVVPIYSTISVIQPGSWVSIYGSGLANGEYLWNADFPTSLGGTTVSINGKPGYLWSVGPGQINLQAPDDTATGPVKIVIGTPFGPINSSVTLAASAPSFSLWPASHYPASEILTPDGSGAWGNGTYDLLGPAGTFTFSTRPVHAGETLVLYGVGFGPTKPAVPAGAVFTGSAPVVTLPTVTIGGAKAQVLFCGVVSAGLYQLTVVVPKVASGDQLLVAKVGSSQTQSTISVPVQ